MNFDLFNPFFRLNSTQKGRWGERKAGQYLKKKGFKIITKNYRKPWGEIDVVAQKGETVHFIEVKSLNIDVEKRRMDQGDYYGPEDNLHQIKIKKLIKVIETYCLEKGIDDGSWQVDAILIRFDKNNGQVLSLEYWPEII